LQALKVVPEPTIEPACQIQVENDGWELSVTLDEAEIERLIMVLLGVLKDKEVANVQ
jgi:hypothetical protein